MSPPCPSHYRFVVDWLAKTVLERGLVSEGQMKKLLAHAALEGAGVAERLYRTGLLSSEKLLGLFIEAGAHDATQHLTRGLPPGGALGAVEKNLAVEQRVIPFAIDQSRVKVGMLDPANAAAIEAITFYAGLAVEPFVVRADVLFSALAEAYGVDRVVPDPTLIGTEMRVMRDSDVPDELPPPSATLPEVRVVGRPRIADPKESPLAAQLAAAAGDTPDYLQNPAGDAPQFGWLRQEGPRSPVVEVEGPKEVKTAPIALRDSIPPQVLPALAPSFRSAILFLVRDEVAVGWDATGLELQRNDVRDVLLPLTGPSCFARAWGWGMVAAGSPRAPTTVERIFFRLLKARPPTAFAVVPVRVGDEVVCLMYVDKTHGALTDGDLEVASQVGSTIADALAPLVKEDALFGMGITEGPVPG